MLNASSVSLKHLENLEKYLSGRDYKTRKSLAGSIALKTAITLQWKLLHGLKRVCCSIHKCKLKLYCKQANNANKKTRT